MSPSPLKTRSATGEAVKSVVPCRVSVVPTEWLPKVVVAQVGRRRNADGPGQRDVGRADAVQDAGAGVVPAVAGDREVEFRDVQRRGALELQGRLIGDRGSTRGRAQGVVMTHFQQAQVNRGGSRVRIVAGQPQPALAGLGDPVGSADLDHALDVELVGALPSRTSTFRVPAFRS